ncbi:hypothetical protein AVEN_83728-1 [Araneus ventricosus]|uniref:Uncharacterized protein n=1 Tax=Araneus ventricosus TaxID=182803 RepID=A0A4Y2EX23_ARAVE|nr:hypothetical protein AVEN_83728-1 [Araneus ventricosus]
MGIRDTRWHSIKLRRIKTRVLLLPLQIASYTKLPVKVQCVCRRKPGSLRSPSLLLTYGHHLHRYRNGSYLRAQQIFILPSNELQLGTVKVTESCDLELRTQSLQDGCLGAVPQVKDLFSLIVSVWGQQKLEFLLSVQYYVTQTCGECGSISRQ